MTQIQQRKKRILVVDDMELFRVLMQDLLTKEGFEVLLARDGLEAVQMVKHELPDLDLVLLDLLLPRLTGFEVLKEIRSGKMGRSLPVLVITGVFKKASQIELLKKLGANGYMTKDLKPDEIIRRIKLTLGVEEEKEKKEEKPQKPLDKVHFLAESEVFAGLNENQLKLVSEKFSEIKLDKDMVIFREGEVGDGFYIIAQGSVRVVKTGESGEEEIIAILEPKTSFGEMALIDQETRSATVITNEPSVLLKITKKDLDELLEKDKDLALVVYKNFVKLLSSRLRSTSESLTFSRALLEELRKE